MSDLGTVFMGKKLASPFIVGACEWTSNMESIKKIEEAGAGAIVIKSLFEEEIQLERLKLDASRYRYEDIDPETARNLFVRPSHAGPEEHLMWTRKAKESVRIPVFASLNCVRRETWLEYAEKLAHTGVDGIELNFYSDPVDASVSAADIESAQLRIFKEVKRALKIPVSVKISPFYTNPLHFITGLDEAGLDGLVFFNRLFQPEIDVASEKHIFPFFLSEPEGHRLPLRYAGLLYGYTKADLCAGTGIFSGKDAARMILAGAHCVQVVSALYRHGTDHLKKMAGDLAAWMKEKGYGTLDDFRGKLSRKNIPDPWVYKRAQYVRMLMQGNPLDHS